MQMRSLHTKCSTFWINQVPMGTLRLFVLLQYLKSHTSRSNSLPSLQHSSSSPTTFHHSPSLIAVFVHPPRGDDEGPPAPGGRGTRGSGGRPRPGPPRCDGTRTPPAPGLPHRPGGPGAARTGGGAGSISNVRGPASCRRRTPAMGWRLPPAATGRARGPPGPASGPDGLPDGTAGRHGGLPDRRGEVDGPGAGRERPEELGAGDERGPAAWEIFIKAEVEGVGWVVLHQDGAGPAEDVEAGVVGGPQGRAVLPALVATSGRGQQGERGMAGRL